MTMPMNIRDNKGFIHVLEAILVALIVVVTLPFLLLPSDRATAWEVARLTQQGEDILATMSEIDVDGNGKSLANDILTKNATQVDREIRGIVGRSNLGYGVTVKGSLKNQIRIGCNCTEKQLRVLRSSLSTSWVNGRRITFRVFPMEPREWSRLDFDVVLINGTAQMDEFNDFYTSSEGNKQLLLDHLRQDHGIVEVIDLQDSDLDTPLQSEVFGLARSSGSGGDVTLTNTDNPGSLNYKTGKYFFGVGSNLNFTGLDDGDERNLTLRNTEHRVQKNITNGVWASVDVDADRNGEFEGDEVNLSEGDTFTVPLNQLYDLEVGKIDRPTGDVHFNYLRGPGHNEYEFADFVSGDPAAVEPSDGDQNRVLAGTSGGLNASIGRKFEGGRVAWISNGKGDDYKGLLKSTILWAAGEDWPVLPRSVTGRQVKVSRYVSHGEEFPEPYWIELTVWLAF